MAGDEHGSIWIESTRDPDGQPVCLVTFDKLQYYAPVEDVRATAIDLVTCAAYAEMKAYACGAICNFAALAPGPCQALQVRGGEGRCANRLTVVLAAVGWRDSLRKPDGRSRPVTPRPPA